MAAIDPVADASVSLYSTLMWLRLFAAAALIIIAATATFFIVFRLRFAHLARLYPHDGQIGLDAMTFGAMAAVAVSAFGCAIGVLVLVLRSRRADDRQ